MKTGIEKLQVRIESDERKKKKIGELLKGKSWHNLKLHDLSFVSCFVLNVTVCLFSCPEKV